MYFIVYILFNVLDLFLCVVFLFMEIFGFDIYIKVLKFYKLFIFFGFKFDYLIVGKLKIK